MQLRPGLLLVAWVAGVCVGASDAAAQRVAGVEPGLFEAVMPEAERFGAVQGDPPVVPAYVSAPGGEEVLHGYVFLTADVPPEPYGYSGPVDALVGMRTDGRLTGVRVTYYRESYRESMGDFLRRPGFQEQFTGKHIGDPFRVWEDVDGISRVSISVRALARGVRDSARRVANAYGLAPGVEALGGAEVDPVGLSWFELRQLGVVERFEVTEPGEGSVGIALALVENERLGEYFLGPSLYERGLQSVERRGGADHLVLYAIDGSRLRLFRREGWSIVQGADTLRIDPRDVVSLGLPSGGVVAGEATLIGLMLVEGPLDIAEPFHLVYDAGEFGVTSTEYVSRQARLAMAEAAAAEAAQAGQAGGGDAVSAEEAPDEAEDDSAAAPPGEATEVAVPRVDTATELEGAGAGDTTPTPTEEPDLEEADLEAAAVQAIEASSRDLSWTEEETLLERTLASTRWGRVATVLLVLALAMAAFLTRAEPLKWTALTATVVLLGFVDGGFLSVSHITSGIWAGAGVYARDIPLLLLVVFTVVTTVVWGRVFCGFLCPFGALQDFIDRLVPDRFKWEPPQVLHDRAVWIKFAVLGAVVLPALLGSRVSIYQYVEPFGTVFFLSPSLLLWAIAGVFLLASVVVPRFYCRYACPLGASLALLSLVSLRRIRRVPQCDVCMVCEQRCPTRAIRGPEIDFPECVRCNVCEIQLETRAGVCRHDMDDVRARLVTLDVRPAGERRATRAGPVARIGRDEEA